MHRPGQRSDLERVGVAVGVTGRFRLMGWCWSVPSIQHSSIRLILPDGLGLGLAGSGSWSGEVKIADAACAGSSRVRGRPGCDGCLRVLVDAEIKRNKGIWWMPWRLEAMKDVARCEKPRGGASTR